MANLREKASRFRALHQGPSAFLIGNAWDPGSARVLAALGFVALATSSGAAAGTLGQRLGVTDIILSLPAGLDSKVGERGVGLSLGQRQSVCFARAMLADPRVVILDEATSSVDSVTEARVQQALFRLLEGRTSFVVAHRLSTIVHANLVLVLEHGRIIERGTHAELLERGGVYAQLYREFVSAQALVA